MEVREILEELERLGKPEAVEGMARFGITPRRTYGVSIPDLRRLAKRLGHDHSLALALWDVDTRETRILASMVDEPEKVTERQMDEWASEFDYWEICDQVCMNLFVYADSAWKKIREWSRSEEEFVRRAALALIAMKAWKDKEARDHDFEEILSVIVQCADDERPMVKKAVSWALRQIGKRNAHLNAKALKVAQEIEKIGTKTAKWVARDVTRELTSERIRKRLGLE